MKHRFFGRMGRRLFKAGAAFAALRHARLLFVRGEIGDELAGVGIGDHRPHGNAEKDILGAAPVLVGAMAVFTVLRAVNARIILWLVRISMRTATA